MPLPEVRIGTWRLHNKPPERFTDEMLASKLYDKYNNERWLQPEVVSAIAGTSREGEYTMRDKNGDIILNVYSGDVEKKDWMKEFLLGERELSEGFWKDLGRMAAYGVTEVADVVSRIGSFEKGSPGFRMMYEQTKAQGTEEKFLQSLGASEQQAKDWEDPKEVAARDEQYQYMLSNILGMGPYLGLPKEDKKPINALQLVQQELIEKIRNEGLDNLEQVEQWRRDMIADRFGYVSDEMLRHWALDEVDRVNIEELKGTTAGGAEYHQRAMRPGGMGVEGFLERPIMGTMAFLGGDLAPFIWAAGKGSKLLDTAALSVMAIKAKPVQIINKVLEKLPTYKYGKNWKWFKKTKLDKSTGKRVPINREINVRNIATAVPHFMLSTEIGAQVAFDPYELRLSKILSEMGFGEDSQDGYLNTIASLWDPEDSEAKARAKMALENVMVLPVGYAVAKTGFSVLSRILRGPKDKAAMYLQRLGTDVEGIRIEKQARETNITPEKLSKWRASLQFSQHGWIRKPINYVLLSLFNKTGKLTPAMKRLRDDKEGVEKAVTTKVEVLANRIVYQLDKTSKATIYKQIDEMDYNSFTKMMMKASAYVRNPTREADWVKITKLITNDFDPTKGESFASVSEGINPWILKDIKTVRNIIDDLSTEIMGSKTVDAATKATIEESLGHHLRRAFKLHDSPGWTPSREAREYFQDWIVKKHKVSPEEAEAIMVSIIKGAGGTTNNFIKTAVESTNLNKAIFKERILGKIKYDKLGNPIIKKGVKVVTTGDPENPKTGVVTKIIRAAKEIKITDESGFNIPRWFFSAKPRYSFGEDKYKLSFESEVDKALYIVADPKKLSKKDADYIEMLKKLYNKFDPSSKKQDVEQLSLFTSRGRKPGPITTTELRALGRELRQNIKKLAISAKGEVDTLVVPKFTLIKPTIRQATAKTLKKGLAGKDTANVRFRNPKTRKTHREEIELSKLDFARTVEYEQELMRVMGLITDPRYNIMNTVQRMVQWTEQEKLLAKWYQTGKGQWFFETEKEALAASAKVGAIRIPFTDKTIKIGPYTYSGARKYQKKPHQFNYQIGTGKTGADLKGSYGALEGKWTTPEMGLEIEGMYQMQQSGMLGIVTRVWNTFLGGKALVNMNKTVMSHITHLRNFFSGPSFMAANGTMPILTDPDALAKAVRVISARLTGKAKKGKGDIPEQELEDLYLRLGVIQSEANMGELKALLGEFSDSTGANIFGKFEQVSERFGWTASGYQAVKKAGKGVLHGTQKLYFAEDDFWKIIYFEHEFGAMTKNLSKLYTEAELQQWAATMVKDTFPTYANVPPLLRKVLRKSPVGNFFSFRAEQIRTTFNIFNTGRKEMQLGAVLWNEGHTKEGQYLMIRGGRRLAGGTLITGMGSSAYSEASRRILGISDAEYYADKELLPYNENPLYSVSWKGEPTIISLESNDPYNVINELIRDAEHLRYMGKLSKQEYETTRRKLLLNMVYKTFEPFVEEAILTSFVATLATMWTDGKAMDGKEIFKFASPDDTVFNHMDKILLYAYNKLLPGTIIAGKRVYDAANGIPSGSGKGYDLETELIANMTALRQRKIDLNSYLEGFSIRLNEHTKYKSNNYFNLYSQIGTLQKGDTAGVLEAIKEYNKNKLITDRRVAYLINSAKIRDLPWDKVDAALKKVGYNSVEITSFRSSNEFVPLDLNQVQTKQKLLSTHLVGKPTSLVAKIASLYNVQSVSVDETMGMEYIKVLPSDVNLAIMNATRIQGGNVTLWSESMNAVLEKEGKIDSLLWHQRSTKVLEANLDFYEKEIEVLDKKLNAGLITQDDYDIDIVPLQDGMKETRRLLPTEEEEKEARREKWKGVALAFVPDPVETVMGKLVDRVKRREAKFEGGAISADHPVSNVKTNPSERVDDNTGLPYTAEMERLGFAEGGENSVDSEVKEFDNLASVYYKDNPNDLEELRKLINYTPPPEKEAEKIKWEDVSSYLKKQITPEGFARGVQQLPYAFAAMFEDIGRMAAIPYDIASTKMPLPNIGAEHRLSTPYAFTRYTEWASDKERRQQVLEEKAGRGMFTEKPLLPKVKESLIRVPTALMPAIDKPQHTLSELLAMVFVDPTIAGPMAAITISKAAPMLLGLTKGIQTSKVYKATKAPSTDQLGFYSQAEKNLVNLPEDQSHLKGQQLLAWVYGRNRNQKNDGVGIFAVTGEEKRILDLEQRVKKNTTPEELLSLIQDRKLRLRHRVLRGQDDFAMSFNESMQMEDPLDPSYNYGRMYAEDIEHELKNLIEYEAEFGVMDPLEEASLFDKQRFGEDLFLIDTVGDRLSFTTIRSQKVKDAHRELTFGEDTPEGWKKFYELIFDETVTNATPSELTSIAELISEQRYIDNPYVKISIAGEVPIDTINVSFIKDEFPARYRELQLENRETIELSELDIYAFGNEDAGWQLIDENEIYRPRSYGQEQIDGRSPAIVDYFGGSRAEVEVQLKQYMREGSQYELGWHDTGEMELGYAQLQGQISLPGGKNYRETPIDLENPEILPEYVMRGGEPQYGHWEHWETPNIVTVTTTDRILNTSKTVEEGKQSALHMEEIQSQVHQAGADPTRGYFDPVQAQVYDELEDVFETASENLAIAREEGASGAKIQRLQEKVTEADLAFADWKEDLMGVKDLPLKKDRYISMLIKKNIMQAIREGKDYVTVANPETILTRWIKNVNVSKEISIRRYHGGGTEDRKRSLRSNTRRLNDLRGGSLSDDGSGYVVSYSKAIKLPGRTTPRGYGRKTYKDLDEFKENVRKDFPKLSNEEYNLVINTEDAQFTHRRFDDSMWNRRINLRKDPNWKAELETYEELDGRYGGTTLFSFTIKGEPHIGGSGEMHYLLYKHRIPRVANKVVKKLDKNARTSTEKMDYPKDVYQEGEWMEGTGTEEVFTIPITEQMKKTLEAQGGMSPFGYAQGGLVKALQERVAKRNGGQMRNYKKEYANYQSRPEQKKNRAKRNAARRSLLRSGRVQKGDGKDVDHKDGNPQNNSPNNLLVKSKSNNRSFSRKGYGKGGDIIKGILTKRLGVPKEIFDKDAVWDQSEEEWGILTKELLAPVDQGGGGMTEDQLPSSAGGRNALNHLIHTGIVHRAYPDREVLTSLGLEAKEMVSAIRNAKPLKGEPLVGVKDSSTDSWNNKKAYNLAKIEEDAAAQSRRRMDAVKDSIIRQHEGQPLVLGEDVMFFDYLANQYYHK